MVDVQLICVHEHFWFWFGVQRMDTAMFGCSWCLGCAWPWLRPVFSELAFPCRPNSFAGAAAVLDVGDCFATVLVCLFVLQAIIRSLFVDDELDEVRDRPLPSWR